ncbi:MAG: hypothetical protein ABSG13_29005 [Bryobacteraceae bacterium]|jgi:hypothetical protein
MRPDTQLGHPVPAALRVTFVLGERLRKNAAIRLLSWVKALTPLFAAKIAFRGRVGIALATGKIVVPRDEGLARGLCDNFRAGFFSI